MASRRAYAPVMHAELGLMEFTARRLHDRAAGRGRLARRPVRGLASDGRDPRRAPAARPHRRGPAHRRVDGRSDVAGHRMDRGRAGRRCTVTSCTSSAASTRRCCASATAPSCTFPAIRCRASPRGASRCSAPISSTTNASRPARHGTPTGPRCSRCSRSSPPTFACFDDFEAALAKARLAVGAMRAARGRRRGRVGARSGGVRRRRRRAHRTAASSPLAVSFLGGDGRHDRPARVAGQHNREVLREVLDLTDDEIDRLELDGVIVRRPVQAD